MTGISRSGAGGGSDSWVLWGGGGAPGCLGFVSILSLGVKVTAHPSSVAMATAEGAGAGSGDCTMDPPFQ